MEIRQGIDIVNVRRMEAVIERHGENFLRRIFAADEIAYCSSKRMKYEHYAARFAAKEAVLKVVHGRRADRFCFREIEVKRKPTGKPFIALAPSLRERFGLPEGYQMELSLAHERDYAVAVVLLVLP